jgi:hypothetical protein
MTEVSNKVSTTQVAGVLAMVAVIYNTLAPAFQWPTINLGAEQLNVFATLIVMVLPTLYMMWRRTKKSALKLGLFK